MKTTKILLTAICTISIFIAASQNENSGPGTLVTDRPDATESPTTIPVGYIQVETGALYSTFENMNVETEVYVYNTALVRYGLLKNFELRLGWDIVDTKTKVDGVTTDISSGFTPLLLGAKIGIAEENGCWPEIGFLGHLFLPFIASSDYKPETTGVNFRFSFAHTLNERSSLSYNAGARWRDDDPQVFYIYTIAYGYSITNKLGAYVELYGNFPEDRSANHLWDAGLTYLLSDSVQLDATVGSGITSGQDLLLSGGISFRIPTKKSSK